MPDSTGLKNARRKRWGNGHRNLAEEHQHHEYHYDAHNQNQQQQQEQQYLTSGVSGGMITDTSPEPSGLSVDGELWETEMEYGEAKSASGHSHRKSVSSRRITAAAATVTTVTTTRATREENGDQEENPIRFDDSSSSAKGVESDEANSRRTSGRSLDTAHQYSEDHSRRRALSRSGGAGDDAEATAAAAAAHMTSTASRTRRSNRKANPPQPIYRTLETGWTPLTRIRLEHAPMPAPETKCMQVFGGVHNYKTKMCEVYERISQICVQVRCCMVE